MEQILSKNNITVEWCDAVDGAKLSDEERKKLVTPLGRYFMTDGMQGCFLSHRKCWERCVESGEPLLVFEDDVVLDENFREMTSLAYETLNKDAGIGSWDVLLLGAFGCVHPDPQGWGFNIIPSLVGGNWRKMSKIVDLDTSNLKRQEQSRKAFVHVPLCPYGCHAYIITPRGAKRLLMKFKRATFHVDAVAFGSKEIDVAALHPLIAWQTHEDTTIGGLAGTWKRFLPRIKADKYTGIGLGWFLSGPLLRIGGPRFPTLLLTNGNSLMLMAIGFLAGFLYKSPIIVVMTLSYVVSVTLLVRLLSSSLFQ